MNNLDDLISTGIKPNASAIAMIIANDDIAVLVWNLDTSVHEDARSFGWDGSAVVFRMPASIVQSMIVMSEEEADHVTARWLSVARPGRIFVLTGMGGTLLVNHDEFGFSLEPKSTDADRARA